MAINKKLIHFDTYSNFNSQKLSANKENTQYTVGVNGSVITGDPTILYQSICFIKDQNKIWTHGSLYDGTKVSDAIENIPVSVNLDIIGFMDLYGSTLRLSESIYNSIKEAIEDKKPLYLLAEGNRIKVNAYIDSSDENIYIQTFWTDTIILWAQIDNRRYATGGMTFTQERLVSGRNIKTINGESILGNGNITIEGGSSLTESDIAAMGFTKNTGTYSKPSGGIPKTDLASAVQTSLSKADTALQSYTEQYKGTITGVSANGTSVATSGVANIPAASTSAYGVTKLTSATNSTSTTLAATASAVKAAYDLANNYKGTVTGVKINGSTKNPSSGVVDLGTVITSHQDISGKQDKLVSGTNIKTINGTSILGSGDIVISGGGSSSGGSGAYAQVYHGTSDTTFTLTPNTFHVWDEVSSLDLTIRDEVVGILNEFIFQFTSGDTATSLVLPDSIVWDEALMILPRKIYQVSILNGLATTLTWAYSKGGKIINFTVNEDVSFAAEEGMSWEDFINGDYNTNIPGLNDKYFVIEDDLPKFALLYEGEVDRYAYILSSYTSTAEQLDDIIINNKNYIVS